MEEQDDEAEEEEEESATTTGTAADSDSCGGFLFTTNCSGRTFGGGGGSTIRACLEVSANQTAVIGSNGILIARCSGNKDLVAVYSLQVCPQQLS